MDEIIERWMESDLIAIMSKMADGRYLVTLLDKEDGFSTEGRGDNLEDAVAQAEEQFAIVANYS